MTFSRMAVTLGLTFGLTPGWTVGAMAQDMPFSRPVTQTIAAGPEAELVARSALPLSGAAQTAFDTEFKGGPYFGAFALGKGGSYGYSVGVNSIEAARLIALAQCQVYEPACLIWADLVPKGQPVLTEGQIILTPEVAGLLRDAGQHPTHRALAVSHGGAYSMVWGHPSQAQAEAAALADCGSYLVADPALPDMPCLIIPGL